MVGLGMIFDETYRPLFEQLHAEGLYRRDFGLVEVELAAVASRTGSRGERVPPGTPAVGLPPFVNCSGPRRRRAAARPAASMRSASPRPTIAISTAPAAALAAGKHVLIEKPSVLRLQELDELDGPGRAEGRAGQGRLPQARRPRPQEAAHPRRRRRPAARQQRLLLAAGAEVDQRQPVRRVDHRPQPRHLRRRPLHQAHRLHLRPPRCPGGWPASTATGQRGLVGPADGPTWDSVQLQMVYAYPDGREAAFDIHTSWVTPDNFPGYVEQEVQFRFDNGVWNAHQRKRGVEVTVEDRTPGELKIHAEPSLQRHVPRAVGRAQPARLRHRDLRRFFEEVAFVEFGGPPDERGERCEQMRALAYNDLSRRPEHRGRRCRRWRRSCGEHAAGQPGCSSKVNGAGAAAWCLLYCPARRSRRSSTPGTCDWSGGRMGMVS